MKIVSRLASLALVVCVINANVPYYCAYAGVDVSNEGDSLYQEDVDSCRQSDLEFDATYVAREICDIYNEYRCQYPDKLDVIDDEVSIHLDDSNFVRLMIFDTDGALACFENSLYMATADSLCDTYANDPTGYYSTNHYIPTVTQKNTYYCGPAATVQALIGNGDISPSDYEDGYDDLQTELANAMGTTYSDGTYLYRLTPVLNAYSGYTYTSQMFTSNTYSGCISYIKTSLMNGKTPIIYLANTSALGYYPSSLQQIHYVTVAMLDTVHEKLLIVDPHYTSTYNGEHYITYDELYEAMKMISVPAADGKSTNSYIIG